jgi:hypothetical protein
VEAVYIPLPNDIHCEWTVKALKAKKHVLCEKPLAVSEAQAEEMFRAAEENGVLLMEAFAYLHSPFVPLKITRKFLKVNNYEHFYIVLCRSLLLHSGEE